MKTFTLNRDWKEFETALRKELAALAATPIEVEFLLDAADVATEQVSDIGRYAEEQLAFLHELLDS